MADNLMRTIVEKAKAGYPALYLLTAEDLRAQREIRRAAAELDRDLFIWTLGKGLVKEGSDKAEAETEDPHAALVAMMKMGRKKRPNDPPTKTIFVLRQFHHFMEVPALQARMLDLIQEFKKTARVLIVLTPVQKLPTEVEKEFALIDMALPDKTALDEVLNGIITGSKLPEERHPHGKLRDEVVAAATGLTTSEAENAFSLSMVRKLDGQLWNPKVVIDEKCQALKKTGLLEYIHAPENGMQEVGGMKNLKAYIAKRRRAFSDEAKAYGLPPPKGILMVGPPGSGKSLGAKAISGELKLPLLRCDMGKLFGSLVGQSEANTRMAIQIAEAVSPCILWLDEIEKGFAGASAGALDSGVGARVLGTFLTWMQEKASAVFVYATANDVTALPPELLRKGRFDEMFSVLLPNASERKEIFQIHITKRGRAGVIGNDTPLKINLDHFANDETEGFSGAEIEAAIIEAMYSSFDDGKELNAIDLQDAVDNMTPLSTTMAEKLDKLKAWCEGRARPANGEDPRLKAREALFANAGKGTRSVDIQ